MSDFGTLTTVALIGLELTLLGALVTWAISLVCHNVGIVDRVWSLMIVAAGCAYAWYLPVENARQDWAIALAVAWALRLSIHITVRGWGHEEDRRYQAIRARNQPGFGFKSLYLVFMLQAVLAWIVSAALLGVSSSDRPFGLLDGAGLLLAAFGIAFEAIADWQLLQFQRSPDAKNKVLDTGLWRYSRHPNYFGEFCTWWGLFLMAASAGAWWSIVSPLLMSVLLLKVSGVTLLEKDIGERRPKYQAYVKRVNAFFPGPRRPGTQAHEQGAE